MNYITKRIMELDSFLTAAEAMEVQIMFEEWHAVDTSEVSQRTIDKALKESLKMWTMGVDAYWNEIRNAMQAVK